MCFSTRARVTLTNVFMCCVYAKVCERDCECKRSVYLVDGRMRVLACYWHITFAVPVFVFEYLQFHSSTERLCAVYQCPNCWPSLPLSCNFLRACVRILSSRYSAVRAAAWLFTVCHCHYDDILIICILAQAMLATQDKLRQLVPGFRFNLGFSGKYFHYGNEEENSGDDLLLGVWFLDSCWLPSLRLCLLFTLHSGEWPLSFPSPPPAKQETSFDQTVLLWYIFRKQRQIHVLPAHVESYSTSFIFKCNSIDDRHDEE